NHGQTPVGTRPKVSCHDGSCTRCKHDECPLEWTKDEQETWTDRAYQKNEKGKQVMVNATVTTTREYMSERIAAELTDYEEHVAHVYMWKLQYRHLISMLQPGHVVIRWDYIGLY